MHRIDLNLLAQLCALLQTRSVTLAADRMGISQPAMSRSLAELRRLFGDPLLVRTRGGMLLTQRAEELAQPLQDWLAQVSTIVLPQAVEPAALRRRFRIIASDFALNAIILPALLRISEAAPGLSVDIFPSAGDSRERLAGGEADLAVGTRHKERHLIRDRLLMQEPYVCVVRWGHPLQREAAARDLAAEEYLRWPRISVGAEAACDLLSSPSRVQSAMPVVARVPSFAAGATLLAGSDAILFAPISSARNCRMDALAHLPAPSVVGAHEHWAIWHNRTHNDPGVRWLIDMLTPDASLLSAANDPEAERQTLTAAE